jgi:hypothetical protein
METKTIDINSVLCAKCRLPASLNDEHLCEFCGRKSGSQIENQPFPWTGFAVVTAIGIALSGIVYFLAWLNDR